VREALADAGPTAERPPFRFSARCRVEVTDTDLGGVVYYGRYAHLIDRAILAYRRHLGIPGLGPDGHLFLVRSLSVEYRASAVFDDEVETFVRVARLGRSSHIVEARLERIGEHPEHLADARAVIVGVREYLGRPTRMPASMNEAIAAFEGIGAGA
jgi:YbgC/YbaW family acyl-CoA thioester hydrolase